MNKAQTIISLIEDMVSMKRIAADKAFADYDFEMDGVMVTDSDGWQDDGPDKLICKFYYDDFEGKKSYSSVFSVVFKPGTAEVEDAGPGYD